MKLKLCILFLLLSPVCIAQQIANIADSLRRLYHIPELGYAVISSDSILDIHISGYKRVDRPYSAELSDRFRVGSNTKTVTAFIAARLVAAGKLSWNTRFFDLFPDWRTKNNVQYHDITLLQLLSFRAGTVKWTYTNSSPDEHELQGSAEEQRIKFARWALEQPRAKGVTSFSNPGYTLAGLMLEQASGKTYAQLVGELNAELGVSFDIGTPNNKDTMQPWGHNAALVPEAPAINCRLNWLLCAGNINSTLPDYAKFIQVQLRGLQGRYSLLPKKDFELMHYGFPDFAAGWFWTEEPGHRVSFHTGNPGTYLSYVYVDAVKDRAYILFTNVQSADAEQAFEVLGPCIKDTLFN